MKARHLGYQRSQRAQKPQTSLVQLENVNSAEEARWYLGKRVAFVYRASKADKKGNKTRKIWGKVTRVHGNSGVVRAKFSVPLPPHSFGSSLRVVLVGLCASCRSFFCVVDAVPLEHLNTSQ